MGHGGTLDPLATGILIVGIGRGTKFLGDFLGCKKTYETVVLFGKSTDTYDVMGKVVAEGPTDTITKSVVEDKMETFRGKLKQVPPIYSAIKIDGMKLYDYARSGKELPRQLESRDVEISDCSLLEFYEPGDHDFRWPAEQAAEEEKAVARKLMEGAEATKRLITTEDQRDPSMSTPREQKQASDINNVPRQVKAAKHTHHLPTQEKLPANAPAARIRLTVSSGFYVRSFAYDMGIACGSYGTMAALERCQQGDFTVADPAPEGFVSTLTYEDLEAGEEVWGSKVSSVLTKWVEAHPESLTRATQDDRDWRGRESSYQGRNGFRGRGGAKRSWNDRNGGEGTGSSRRRNSSSPEG